MVSTLLAIAAVVSLQAEDGRLLRFPDVYQDKVVFTYAGDLWLSSLDGGIARKLTNDEGVEGIAKFSPDGKWIAFQAAYEGNVDIYVMPSDGGVPKRLTFHPGPDVMVDWTADGKEILFRSGRSAFSGRFLTLYKVPANGGTPVELPVGECGLASMMDDNKTIAYNRMPTENAAWKQYRGGLQSFISFYDLETNRYWEMPHDRSAYLWPMAVGDQVFYANDSTGRYNLYSYNTKSGQIKKWTNFSDFDVKWPSYGTGTIVFERNARLWKMDTRTGQVGEIKVRILSDQLDRRPRVLNVGSQVASLSLSPKGERLALEAMGELFSVPAEEGVTYNFSNTPGAREKFATWSPDGKTILFLSDRSGEEQFYIIPADLSAEPTQVTSENLRMKNPPVWSPDSKKFVYTDADAALWVVDVEGKSEVRVALDPYAEFGPVSWSPDSKWLAYAKGETNGIQQIYVYDVANRKEYKLSDGRFNDSMPIFDTEGKYLFFVSDRDFAPTIGAGFIDLSFILQNTKRIYGWTLRPEIESPFAPKNPIEGKSEAKQPSDQGNAQSGQEQQKQEVQQEQAKQEKDTNPVWEGIAGRLFMFPLPPSQMYALIAAAPGGRVIYADANGTVQIYTLNNRSSSALISGVASIDFTPDFQKFAYLAPGGLVGVLPVRPGAQVGQGRVSTADMLARVDPVAEWKQSFWDAWRYERDHFWAPNMNGLDWRAIGEQYAAWIPHLGDRSDLDYLLRELLGELRTGHAYVIPGSSSVAEPMNVGLLGADFEPTSDGVRIKKIYKGHNWDPARVSPLNQPGLGVEEGMYLVAIDGQRVTGVTNVYELLTGKAGRLVELTVNDKPTLDGAKKVVVRTVGNEGGIRYADWIDRNLKYVEERSGGRIGYVHVPSTSVDGIIEFYKMYVTQTEKDALIVDERFNSGGFIPTFFVQTLGASPLAYWTARPPADFRTPFTLVGPKCMLINHYGGSGGDAFPYFFRKMGLGPLIGTRTWGGLVGIRGSYPLMSGGAVTAPQFAIWDMTPEGPKWVVENIGVPPDIEVDNTPDKVSRGMDPQLDAAIDYLLDQLRKNPAKKPQHPPYHDWKGGGQ